METKPTAMRCFSPPLKTSIQSLKQTKKNPKMFTEMALKQMETMSRLTSENYRRGWMVQFSHMSWAYGWSLCHLTHLFKTPWLPHSEIETNRSELKGEKLPSSWMSNALKMASCINVKGFFQMLSSYINSRYWNSAYSSSKIQIPVQILNNFYPCAC